jgi:hypothetical protein
VRQPGLFDDVEPRVQLPPVELDVGGAFDFYRNVIGEPALIRARTYAEFGRGPPPSPVAADWLAMAAVLLGDRPHVRAARERVTVLVGDYARGVCYEVAREDGWPRVLREFGGRFLVVVHSAFGLTVSCRLVPGDELARLGVEWGDAAAAFFRGRTRRPWRASVAWDYLAAKGERVLSIRDGRLTYPV